MLYSLLLLVLVGFRRAFCRSAFAAMVRATFALSNFEMQYLLTFSTHHPISQQPKPIRSNLFIGQSIV
jgi:hypothetical protein